MRTSVLREKEARWGGSNIYQVFFFLLQISNYGRPPYIFVGCDGVVKFVKSCRLVGWSEGLSIPPFLGASPMILKILYHQRRASPYIFGRSPRIYDSKARFKTVAQSKSRRSSSTLSSLSWESGEWWWGFGFVNVRRNACRAMRSPSANRGPRSGQLRAGSKGFHLRSDDDD